MVLFLGLNRRFDREKLRRYFVSKPMRMACILFFRILHNSTKYRDTAFTLCESEHTGLGKQAQHTVQNKSWLIKNWNSWVLIKIIYLQFGVFIHHNCNHSNIWQETLGSTNYIFWSQPKLTRCVQASVIHTVVVSFGKKLCGAIPPLSKKIGNHYSFK